MQEIKYFTCIYHSVLFFCSKRCKIKFDSLFDCENINRKELQNIAINHSAEIHYQDFMKIYRKCTEELYSFLTIDTTLPSSNPLRFRKKLFHSYKNDSN